MRRGTRSAWCYPVIAVSAVLAAGGCVGEKSTPLGTGPSSVVKEGDGPASAAAKPELPVLVEIESKAGETFTRVLLHFEPGSVEPTAELKEYDNSTVRAPSSGKPVDLRGAQALRVTVSPAQLDKVNVAPVRRGDPAITEVRVLGGFEKHVSIGIGVKRTDELRPKVLRSEHDTNPDTNLKYDTIVISLRNPPPGQ